MHKCDDYSVWYPPTFTIEHEIQDAALSSKPTVEILGKSIHMKQKLHTTKCYNKLHVYIVCLSYSTCNVVTTESQFLTSTFQLFHTSSEWMNPLRCEQTTDIKDFIQVQNSSSQRESESLP